MTTPRVVRALIQGVPVSVESADASVLEAFAHDFSRFIEEGSPRMPGLSVRLLAGDRRPDGWRSMFRAGGSVIHWPGGSEQRVEFFGRAWVSYSFANGRAEIYCADADIAYEALYLVVLSYVGERLDRRGLHRVHGLGLAFRDSGVILLGRPGAGKSTLALALLSQPGPDIVSDDTPVVATNGVMREFPLRIAVTDEPRDVPAGHVRTFRRVRYGEKFVVGASWFNSRIRASVPVRHIIELRGRGDGPPRIRRGSRIRLAWLLVRWLVIGFDVPQIWQLFLRLSAADLAAKARIAGLRLLTAASLTMRCRFWRFDLSRDPVACSDELRRFGEIHT